MRDQKMIEYIVRELEETEIPLDDHMKGYLNALKWVLNEKKEA